jgi:hypothetical protein
MTYKPFILLLGILLSSCRTVAQTPAPRNLLVQEQAAPTIRILPTISTALPAFSFLLSQGLERSNVRFSLPFAGAYPRDYRLDHLSPMDEVRTLILTQSSLPLLQFWGGRLQLDAFQSTLRIQNGLLGGMRGSRLAGQNYAGAMGSIHLSGLSLRFRFGREARTGHPVRLWGRLTQTLDAVLN